MWERWYQTARLRREIAAWRMAGNLAPGGVDHVREQHGAGPEPHDWIEFLRQLCAWLGCVMLASAAVCAVAANWAQISPMTRLLALQGLLAATVVATLLPRFSRLVRTLLLLLACILLGALLALVGQTYQTGADPWQLFALWALLMLPWVLAGRSVVLCLLWVLIGNVALLLWGQEGGLARESVTLAVFALGNGGLLIVWETGRRRFDWLRVAAASRLLVAWLVGVLAVFTALESIRTDAFWSPAMMWWLLATGGVLAFYRYARRDVAALAVALLGVIGVVTAQCGARIGWPQHAEAGLFALLGLLVIAQAAIAAAWLRRIAGDEP